MHDWWLALCAAAMGEVLYLPEATVLYRQHGLNAPGSRGWRVVCRETYPPALRLVAALLHAVRAGRPPGL